MLLVGRRQVFDIFGHLLIIRESPVLPPAFRLEVIPWLRAPMFLCTFRRCSCSWHVCCWSVLPELYRLIPKCLRKMLMVAYVITKHTKHTKHTMHTFFWFHLGSRPLPEPRSTILGGKHAESFPLSPPGKRTYALCNGLLASCVRSPLAESLYIL